MILLRLLAAAILSAAFLGPAAAQGVKIAGESAPAGPAASAPKSTASKPKKKAKAAKPKKKAVESRYKTTKLSEGEDNHYKFDEDGDPVTGEKKTAPKAKASCVDEDSCSDKGVKRSEADSL